MIRLPDNSASYWLAIESGRDVSDLFTGIEPPGYPARARIFHAMYEAAEPSRPRPGSLHSFRGLLKRPDAWSRILWRDMARREGIPFDAPVIKEGVDVVDFWSPMLMRTEGWLESQLPPPTGSLDYESLARLLDVLVSRYGNVEAFAYYCPLVPQPPYPDSSTFAGSLTELAHLADEMGSSPNNWWSADRSWVVYTNHDLPTTVVLGAPELVQELVSDAVIEAYAAP